MKKMLYISWLIFFSINAFGQNGIISTVVGSGIGGYSGDGGQALNAELNLPDGITLDKSGNVYISDWANNRIRKIDVITGIITTIAGNGLHGYGGDGGSATSAELAFPNDIAFDSIGNIYIADESNNDIRKITVSTGIIITIAGNGYPGYYGDGGLAVNAALDHPEWVKFDKGGNLYISVANSNVIRKITISTGIINTIVGNGYLAGTGNGAYSGDGGPATAAELNGPFGFAFDSAENIYFADGLNDVIREVTASTGIINTVVGIHILYGGYSGDGGPATAAEIREPMDITFDMSGKNMYFSDCANNVIREVNGSTRIITTIVGNGKGGFSGDGGPATLAEMQDPFGIALNSSGDLYIADEANNVIRKITNSIRTETRRISNNDEVSVFPNPAKNEITVQFVGTQNFVSTIQFYDLTGREVLTQTLTKATTTINCSGLSEGAYLYKIIDENGKVVKADKIVVER